MSWSNESRKPVQKGPDHRGMASSNGDGRTSEEVGVGVGVGAGRAKDEQMCFGTSKCVGASEGAGERRTSKCVWTSKCVGASEGRVGDSYQIEATNPKRLYLKQTGFSEH